MSAISKNALMSSVPDIYRLWLWNGTQNVCLMYQALAVWLMNRAVTVWLMH